MVARSCGGCGGTLASVQSLGERRAEAVQDLATRRAMGPPQLDPGLKPYRQAQAQVDGGIGFLRADLARRFDDQDPQSRRSHHRVTVPVAARQGGRSLPRTAPVP
jgi:hypothetical protein